MTTEATRARASRSSRPSPSTTGPSSRPRACSPSAAGDNLAYEALGPRRAAAPRARSLPMREGPGIQALLDEVVVRRLDPASAASAVPARGAIDARRNGPDSWSSKRARGRGTTAAGALSVARRTASRLAAIWSWSGEPVDGRVAPAGALVAGRAGAFAARGLILPANCAPAQPASSCRPRSTAERGTRRARAKCSRDGRSARARGRAGRRTRPPGGPAGPAVPRGRVCAAGRPAPAVPVVPLGRDAGPEGRRRRTAPGCHSSAIRKPPSGVVATRSGR